MEFRFLINFKIDFERKTFIFEHDWADRVDICSSTFMIFVYACMPFSQNATGSPILCCVKKKILQGFISNFDFVFHPSVIIYIIFFHNFTRRSVDDSAECGCIHGAVALHGLLHAVGTNALFCTATNDIFSCFFSSLMMKKIPKSVRCAVFSARPQSFPSTGINIFAVLPVEHRQGRAIGFPALHSINSAREKRWKSPRRNEQWQFAKCFRFRSEIYVTPYQEWQRADRNRHGPPPGLPVSRSAHSSLIRHHGFSGSR